MRLVHLADLHLGIRQFQRQTAAGMNQREADVASVFQRVIDKVVQIAPDVVLFAGDVFHNVRPSNQAILHTFGQLSRLTRSLPNTVVIMIAGNHDTPRSSETGGILRLFSPLGVHVVDVEPQRLAFPDRDLSILAVPDISGAKFSYDTDASARYNVFVAHGDMPGSVPDKYGYSEPAALQLAPEEIGFARWSYVALGHHHVYHQLAPNACYAGSIDYTSANIWGERAEERAAKLPGKGMVEYHLDTKKRIFHKIEPARDLIDLPVIEAAGKTAAEIDAAIARHVMAQRGGIDDKIVRQVVRDLPLHVARELDHRALRELRRRALQYHLDTRRPELLRAFPLTTKGGRRPSLKEMMQDYLWSRTLPPEVDRAMLVQLGLKYLDEADARDVAAGAPSPTAEGA